MAKQLTSETIIELGKLSLSSLHEWLKSETGRELPGCELRLWLESQSGRTLGEAREAFVRECERKSMPELMREARFCLISDANRSFICAFTEAMERIDFGFGGGIGEGYCWGKYMVIYSKGKKVAARIFIREGEIVLRLFLNGIDRHRAYIESAPEHIREIFTTAHGDCRCQPRKENCRMRKVYTVGGKTYEKCGGVVFEVWSPTSERLDDYAALIREFYPERKAKK